MTTKKRFLSESESGDGSSPTNGAKYQKTDDSLPNQDVVDDDPPILPNLAAQNLRVSARVLRKKEERKESEGVGDELQDLATNDDAGGVNRDTNPNENGQKKKRSWGCWSAEDQRLFFEALNECGKNFDAIELFFQNKGKKGKPNATTTGTTTAPGVGATSAPTMYKHKDQIRTFYYRSWHKICKYLKFPENLKKSWRELYGLINFGELRKKVGNDLDRKKGEKLQELVFNGHTTVRCKGKTIRLKTPMCPALKKLSPTGHIFPGSHNHPEAHQEVDLPRKVTLELSPLLVNDFYRVNRMALSNPRISISISLDCRLSSVIKKLENRFSPIESRMWLNCVALLPKAETFTFGQQNMNDSELWIVPKPGTILSKPTITMKEQMTSTTLSLSNLQSKLDLPNIDDVKDQPLSADGQPPCDISNESIKQDQDTNTDTTKNEDTGSAEKPEVADPIPDQQTDQQQAPAQEVLTGISLFNEETAEQGWNVDSGKLISIGELFLLMAGNDSSKTVLLLNYTWKKKEKLPIPDNAKNGVIIDTDVQGSSVDEFDDCGVMRELAKMANVELSRKVYSKPPMSPMHLKRQQRPNVGGMLSPRPISDHDAQTSGHDLDAMSAQTKTSDLSEFRRPAVPPARQMMRQQMGIVLPKYNQRKGRPMSRSKNYLVQQLNAARPIQPKTVISGQNGIVKRLLHPQEGLHGNGIALTATHSTLLTMQTLPTIISVVPPVIELGQPPIAICTSEVGQDSIPQISIPSPAYETESNLHDAADQMEEHVEEDANVGASNDTFSLSFLDENSRSDMEPVPRNITSTPAHLQVDHFLDSVLENSNSSLLQTPRRSSPPLSPPGGISEHSWLRDISLTSFLGALPSSADSRLIHHQEDSIQSTGSEVDRQLSLMLNENSLDFTNKFAHLASALNSAD